MRGTRWKIIILLKKITLNNIIKLWCEGHGFNILEIKDGGLLQKYNFSAIFNLKRLW
jgi:hypothetical protein